MTERITEITLRVQWDDERTEHPSLWVWDKWIEELADDAKVVSHKDVPDLSM